MKRIGLAALAILGMGAVYYGWLVSNAVPQVPAHQIARGSFENLVTTNGRVEPSHWASARAERDGLVVSVSVTKGQRVGIGTTLAVLDSRDAKADLAAANARIEEATATLRLLEAGGRKRDTVEIDQSISQKRAEKLQVEKELAIAERLLARNAGTREEVRTIQDRLELLQLQITALEARRPVLVSSSDVASAKARLREAESSAELARRRIELSTVRSPVAGVVYQLDVKQGSFLTPGALVASIGNVDTLKVIVFVDEPELGKIQKGMPVSITWDAMEGRKWSGTLDKIPTQIVPLGTRQVGEVECLIENPENHLLPGTNINASIQTRKQDAVMLVPKEAIRNRDGSSGVYVIESGTLAWRKIELGNGNPTSSIVLSGLKEGDLVALGPETVLKAGSKVEIAKP